jgi:hypothetical protein
MKENALAATGNISPKPPGGIEIHGLRRGLYHEFPGFDVGCHTLGFTGRGLDLTATGIDRPAGRPIRRTWTVSKSARSLASSEQLVAPDAAAKSRDGMIALRTEQQRLVLCNNTGRHVLSRLFIYPDAACLTGDGTYVFVGDGALLSVWDGKSATKLAMIPTSHEGEIMTCRLNGADTELITIDVRGRVCIWPVADLLQRYGGE